MSQKLPTSPELKPLRLRPAQLYFAFPCGLMALGVHLLMPAFYSAGFPILYGYSLAFGIPLFVILGMAIAAYRLEGNAWNWKAFRQRYRLLPLRRADWFWVAGILVAQGLVSIPFSLVENQLIEAAILPFPLAAQLSLAANEALLQAGLLPVLVVTGLLVINVLAEELWFRGYVFPRQALVHGQRTWIAHWMSWWFVFHIFKWWGLITILPVTGLTVYLYHRTRKTTTTLLVHFLGNFFSIGLVILAMFT